MGSSETKRMYSGRTTVHTRDCRVRNIPSAPSTKKRKGRAQSLLRGLLWFNDHRSSLRQRERRGERRHFHHRKPMGRMAFSHTVGAQPHCDISLRPQVQDRAWPRTRYRLWKARQPTPRSWRGARGKQLRVQPRSHTYKSGDGSAAVKKGQKWPECGCREKRPR